MTPAAVRTAFLLTVALCLITLFRPSSAGAAEYPVHNCFADQITYSTQAFDDFATRGMMWRRACSPEGAGRRGLLNGNVIRRGRVRRGARSYFVMRAPNGTRFGRFTWSGKVKRSDCGYAMQVWASGPNGGAVPIRNVRANQKCPRPGRNAQAAGWPKRRTRDVSGANKIIQRIICVGRRRTPSCSTRGENYIRTFVAKATVVDVSPPTVRIVPNNPFTLGRWVSGNQTVSYDAADNVGVSLARALVGGLLGGAHQRPCGYTQSVPCPNGPGSIIVDTRRLSDGSRSMAVQAFDSAQNPLTSAPVTVRLDNTAPGAIPVAVEGAQGWRNQNGFALTWANPAEVDRAPIVKAFYRLCNVDAPSGCVSNSRAGIGISRIGDITVPAPGEWRAHVWRQDAAGNHEPANASVPVTLRYDPEPPQLGFEQSPALDPTLFSVQVTDKFSGLAGGQIELSRQGSGIWQSLATQQQGSRLLARINDAQLPAGTYLLRATARDHASNQNSSSNRLDGRPMVVNLPLRTPTVTRSGVRRIRIVRREVGTRRNRRRVRRRVETVEPQARVAFGRPAQVVGQLLATDGRPLPNAELQVLSRTALSPERLEGVIRTGANGEFVYTAGAGSTRTLRFAYQGTSITLPSTSEVTLFVPAASTLRPRPRRLRNGQAVRFAGRLQSLPPPAAGKLVELQVVLSGRWQTFRTTRTDAGGGWKVRYRFRRSCGLTRYRFRARLPAETGYPFEPGTTKPVKVTVRGPVCR